MSPIEIPAPYQAPVHLRNNGRGYQLYNVADQGHIHARDKQGRSQIALFQWPLFLTTPEERNAIFKQSDLLFGPVFSRMNKISSYDIAIEDTNENLDEVVAGLRDLKDIANELEGQTDLKYAIQYYRAKETLLEFLPELLPDLSNFEAVIRRWARSIKSGVHQSNQEVLDWISQPNREESWPEFCKIWVADLHIHGNSAKYQMYCEDGVLRSLHSMPGGSVFPFTMPELPDVLAWIQYVYGAEPTLMYQDECIFDRYCPTSWNKMGLSPVDALLNKLVESQLFDILMKEQADGSKPPEKLVVFSEPSPIADLGEGALGAGIQPLSGPKQRRLEDKFNELRRGAIATLTGYGKSEVLDLTRENTMPIQMERQTDLKKSVAMVYNMSPLEINESSDGPMTGSTTAEAEERLDQKRGEGPIIKTITISTTTAIKKRWRNKRFKFENGYEERRKIAQANRINETGVVDTNYVRTEILSLPPYPEDQYNRPAGNPIAPEPGEDAAPSLSSLFG